MGSIYHGATQLKPVSDKDYEYVGKTRQRQVLPEFIMLNLKQENAVFVLLHEIAHCFAPQVEHKRDGEWVKEDHSKVFYEQFWTVIKEAQNQGLYHKTFDNLQHLIRYDKSVWLRETYPLKNYPLKTDPLNGFIDWKRLSEMIFYIMCLIGI